ncbi:MAG: [FeFe] hydrogenase H-cluster maturation GTPase HydF [Bacteroidales bacterium]|nr:[FeFe] hydrogenase H-cluster maturation GTPase HydF [Bacteroidales bacterium]MBN2819564.1 [FeFe] hydrogenase H-cluster maturation GTPase HydF [Bacteroidales bacterium]
MNKGRDNKPHIGIFGRRNNGKSSIINLLSGQDIAIVSDVAGTTTDPVKKSVEIHGIGPVIFIDTAGIDDTGELGNLRIAKTLKAIESTDLAILVISQNRFESYESNLIDKFENYKIPYLILHNKSDLVRPDKEFIKTIKAKTNQDIIEFSTKQATKSQVEVLIKTINKEMPSTAWKKPSILGDLVSYGDIVLLITPIDVEAPEGRLILPQIQTIRDILDNDCTAIILKEREVDSFLRKTKIKPKLAVTDSQVFLKADASIPKDIPLTSFSILLARQKGDFYNYIKGTPKISELKDGDRVLLLESCTHHVSCDDIARVKIPRWISNYTGKKIEYDTVAGLDNLPRPIEEYSLVIQCGGCMITQKQLQNRLKKAIENQIPVSNYGMAISYVQGIFNRAVAPFIKHDTSEDYL